MQRFLRRDGEDAFSSENSFMYGRSTADQQIEAWWSVLKKQCTNFRINKFTDMHANAMLDYSDPFQREPLRFSFMDVIQKNLYRIVS